MSPTTPGSSAGDAPTVLFPDPSNRCLFFSLVLICSVVKRRLRAGGIVVCHLFLALLRCLIAWCYGCKPLDEMTPSPMFWC